jgi:hypothetical protein
MKSELQCSRVISESSVQTLGLSERWARWALLTWALCTQKSRSVSAPAHGQRICIMRLTLCSSWMMWTALHCSVEECLHTDIMKKNTTSRRRYQSHLQRKGGDRGDCHCWTHLPRPVSSSWRIAQERRSSLYINILRKGGEPESERIISHKILPPFQTRIIKQKSFNS